MQVTLGSRANSAILENSRANSAILIVIYVLYILYIYSCRWLWACARIRRYWRNDCQKWSFDFVVPDEHTRTHAHTHTLTRTHTHTCAHTRTHAHTHKKKIQGYHLWRRMNESCHIYPARTIRMSNITHVSYLWITHAHTNTHIHIHTHTHTHIKTSTGSASSPQRLAFTHAHTHTYVCLLGY